METLGAGSKSMIGNLDLVFQKPLEAEVRLKLYFRRVLSVAMIKLSWKRKRLWERRLV